MEANDASLGSGDASTRAQELRAGLGARLDAEALLAEAGRIRQVAASAADALVEEAQALSTQLVDESRRSAEQIIGEARERADGVLARARIEAEEVGQRARAAASAMRSSAEDRIEEQRRRVRAEVTAQVTRDLTEQNRLADAGSRGQSEALTSDLEAAVRILGVSLESALANVSDLLTSLEVLRSTADPAARVPETALRSEPRTTVPEATSRFDTVVGATEGHPHRPRSATEAFLSSSSLEVEQASRELLDLQDPEDARHRRGEESRRAGEQRELRAELPDDAEPDQAEADQAEAARPLGWLFRTAH
jgi:hypothetical protein